jgi:hypothetical protein
MIRKSILCVLVLCCSQSASAQYYAEGEIMGYVHTGIGKMLPAFSKEVAAQKIHAVKHHDGKMYKLKRIYADSAVTVTATNECLVKPTDEDPVYLGRSSDGHFEELSVQYIKFRCTKQSG